MVLLTGIFFTAGTISKPLQGVRVLTCTTYSDPSTVVYEQRNVPKPGQDPGAGLTIPPSYPEYIIRFYGPVPLFTRDHRIYWHGDLSGQTGKAEWDVWHEKLGRVVHASVDTLITSYGYPHGPIISYSHDLTGSVVVGIEENSVVDPVMYEGMYSVIAMEARNQGIADVPVIFCSEKIIELIPPEKEIRSRVYLGRELHLPDGIHFPLDVDDYWL